MLKKSKLILGSQSEARLALLAQIGIVPDYVIGASSIEAIHPKEGAKEAVMRLAFEKQEALLPHVRSLNNAETERVLILTADTLVAVGRRILGKPNDREEAAAFLALLSGRAHRVFTAVVLSEPSGLKRFRVVQTRVQFKRLHEEEFRAYLDTEEWRNKSGAYALQGRGELFVRKIIGSYSSAVGLPLRETHNLLKGFGYSRV